MVGVKRHLKRRIHQFAVRWLGLCAAPGMLAGCGQAIESNAEVEGDVQTDVDDGTQEPEIGLVKSSGWKAGSATYYNLGSNKPHCAWAPGASRAPKTSLPYVAMNEFDLQGYKGCGSCVEIVYNGKKIKAEVVDLCPAAGNPKCKKGHLDIKESAFTKLAARSVGYIRPGSGLQWRYVPCP